MQNDFSKDFMHFFKILRSASALVLVFFLLIYLSGIWKFLFSSIEVFKLISVFDISIMIASSLMKPIFHLAKLLFPEL